jgi:amidohydrolase
MNVKSNFKKSLDEIYNELCDVSAWMYENPELGFEEFKTSKYLVEYINKYASNTIFPTHNLETAFEVTFGDKGPLTVICVEYDALPEIGHACGHNIIATAAIGAGLALRNYVNELGIRVKLLGTPAEEGGGGKIVLLDSGAFEDAACSMMIHPGIENVVNPTFTTIQQYTVEYFGKDAHAAGAPEEGINALDAQIQLFVNASTYRQQMLQTNRMHGVISEGGFKPNIIPSYTKSEWYLRSLNKDGLEKIESDFYNFVNAAAMATKC